MPKRKRTGNGGGFRAYKARRVMGRGRKWVIPTGGRGYARTSGFYGRFRGRRSTYTNGGELKFFDLDLDDATVANGGTITDSINKIAQGTTESTRIGRKCTIRSIGWRFEVTLPIDTTVGLADVVRVIMYLDKQCNGATATVTDILESANFQSFNNLANKSRFRTLMDRTYAINVSAAAGNGTSNDAADSVIEDSFFKKCNLALEFDATAGAITEIRSNNIGVLLIARTGAAGFSSKIRLRFSDN